VVLSRSLQRLPACVLVAAAMVGCAPAASAIPVRVFAVGSKVDVRYADTYQNFRDKMFALVDAHHPRGSSRPTLRGGSGRPLWFGALRPGEATAPGRLPLPPTPIGELSLFRVLDFVNPLQ
jgi:hypothetical protein